MKVHRFQPKATLLHKDVVAKIEAKTGKRLHKDKLEDPDSQGYVSWWWDPETSEVLLVEVGYEDHVVGDPMEAEL